MLLNRSHHPLYLPISTVLVAGLVLVSRPSAIAQTAVFDDFEYAKTTQLFGSNAWTGGEVEQLWYPYLWQGGDPGEVHLDNGVLSLATASVNSTQIMSGLVARRGTWAARVNVSYFDNSAIEQGKQAFWLYSPMHGSRADEPGTITRWNEIDFEWWNVHSNTHPDHHWLRTGHTVGDKKEDYSGGVQDEIINVPLGGTPYTWSCTLNSADGTVHKLSGPDCSAVILGQYAGPTGLGADPYMVLMIHVSDDGVRYEVKASGEDGAALRASAESSRVPNLPMAAMFLQEYALGSTETFVIDWFYYSPDVSPTIDAVLNHVSELKRYARYNNTGIDLKRPEKYLGSCSKDASLTTALDITLPKPIPEVMTPGETVRIVALPPTRQGRFRYKWWYISHYGENILASLVRITPDYGGWETDFTFPQRATAVTLTIRLSEVEDEPGKEGEECTNEPVKPIERSWTIKSRWARFESDISLESTSSRAAADLDPKRSQTAVSLHSYPNPFNPQTTVSFTLPKTTWGRLKIFDLTGRVVDVLADGYLCVGTHNVNWNASHVATGVYVAVLQAGSERAVTRLTVAK